MVIVVEGHDLAGKSTLTEALSMYTQFPILNNRSYKFSNEAEHHKLIDFKANVEYNFFLMNIKLFPSLIIDRFIISNIVYPKIYKRNYDYSYMKKEDWKDIDLKLVFVAIEDEKIIEERLRKRGDFLDLNLQKIVALREAYKEAFKEFGMPYLTLNGSLPILDNINIMKNEFKL